MDNILIHSSGGFDGGAAQGIALYPPDGQAHWSDQSLSLDGTIDYLLPISRLYLQQKYSSCLPAAGGVVCPLLQHLRDPLKPAMQIDPPRLSQMIPPRISADRKRRGSFILSSCGPRASFH